jgi:hypothetical protein
MVETQFIIKQLGEAGVEAFAYMGDRSLTPTGWLDKPCPRCVALPTKHTARTLQSACMKLTPSAHVRATALEAACSGIATSM